MELLANMLLIRSLLVVMAAGDPGEWMGMDRGLSELELQPMALKLIPKVKWLAA